MNGKNETLCCVCVCVCGENSQNCMSFVQLTADDSRHKGKNPLQFNCNVVRGSPGTHPIQNSHIQIETYQEGVPSDPEQYPYAVLQSRVHRMDDRKIENRIKQKYRTLLIGSRKSNRVPFHMHQCVFAFISFVWR